jgi:hypothetical protein
MVPVQRKENLLVLRGAQAPAFQDNLLELQVQGLRVEPQLYRRVQVVVQVLPAGMGDTVMHL